MTKNPRPATVVGLVVHFFGSTTLTLSDSDNAGAIVTEYGMERYISQQVYDGNVSEDGTCWLDMALDPEKQMTDKGKVLVAIGPWPEGKLRFQYGSPRWQEARGAAMREASALQDPAAQAAARRAAKEKYGPPETTSRTFVKYPDTGK